MKHLLIFLTALLTGLTCAQPEAPGGVLIPPSVPGTPAPALPPPVIVVKPGQPPVPGQPAVIPLAEQKITEGIVHVKLTGTELARLYRSYTGRRVIVTTAASTAEFSFVQDASPADPLTYGQAAELLKKAATVENFVFVPDASDPNLDILTLATGGINPKGRGIAVFTESDTLPEGDAVISYVMNLQYLKPDAVVTTFNQIIGQFGAFGSIAPVPNAAAVVITENTSLIRRLIELERVIDVPSSEVKTKFFKVEYADVTELSEILNELLTAQAEGKNTAGVQRTGAAPAAPGTPATNVQVSSGGTDIGIQTGGTTSGEETPIQIVPETRTNRIFAMGRPVDLLFIEGLITEFDIPSDQRNFLRRKLKFLKVADFLGIAEDALGRVYSSGGTTGGSTGANFGGAGGAQGGQSNQAANRQTSNRQGASNTNRSSNNSTNSSSFGGGSGGSGGGGGGTGGSSGLNAPDVNSAPESRLVGRTLLVADNITNSIVVQGPPAGVEIIERLLDQIDVKADQVMISTVFGQLSLSDNFALGVDFLQTFNGVFAGSAGGGDSGGLIPLNPGGVFNAGTLGGGGLNIYGKIGDNLNVYLTALQSNENFVVLSRPSIFTSNSQKATISSGERVAIPTNSNSFSGGGQSTNIEYQDVVLKLEVIPLVNSPDEITLQIALVNDEVNGNQVLAGAGPDGQNLVVPRITTREIFTTVTVPNNETIVLGGLIVSRDNKTVSGVPILSSIPVLGKLFSTTSTEKDRSELLIFIQPSIVSGSRSLDNVQADMDSRYQVAPPIRKLGDGPGVLPPPDSIPLSEKSTTTTTSRAVIVGKPAKKHIGRFR